jgi:hypothetical protein
MTNKFQISNIQIQKGDRDICNWHNLNLLKRSIYFAFVIIVAALAGCTEKIDVNLDQQQYARLVVDARFSSDTMSHLVKLSTTSDYFDNQAPKMISGAEVTISNAEEKYFLTEMSAGSGNYYTDPQVAGRIGSDYQLDILLPEAIGGIDTYSATSHIYPISQMDSIALEFHDEWGPDGIWEVKCYVWDPPTEDYYMFNLYRNGVLVTDTISKVFVVDDLLYNGNYTNGIGVGYLNQADINQQLFPGDVVTLSVSRITRDYAEFLWELQEEVSYQTPLFSGAPANVNGNISNGAFGAFGAWSSSSASQIVSPPE